MDNLDFKPTEELLKIQGVELDILKEFQRVCAKYNLTYFAAGGTLLGAARHKGMIPWDDDIDVQMPYEDYLRFEKVVQDELSFPYAFQSYKTNIGFDISPMARIRNSETTGCTKWEFDNVSDPTYNRGIFLDIWVLFPVPKEQEKKEKQKEEIDKYWRAIRGWNAYQNKLSGRESSYEQYLPYWEEVCGKHTIEYIKDRYMDSCNYEGVFDEIAMTSFRTNSPKFTWLKQWFDESIDLPFNDTTIKCPKMYDEVLTKQYGDWRTPVMGGAIHEMVICDVETPYYKRLEFQK